MTITNHYHGCTVESDIDAGTHRIFAQDGTDLGSADTLAEAVAVCRAQAELTNEQPPVAEAATELLIEEN